MKGFSAGAIKWKTTESPFCQVVFMRAEFKPAAVCLDRHSSFYLNNFFEQTKQNFNWGNRNLIFLLVKIMWYVAIVLIKPGREQM